MRRPALWIVVVLASLVVLGVFAQAYLISAGKIGAGEPDAVTAHGNLGGVVHAVEVLAFLAAIAAYWKRWARLAWPFALAVVGTVQIGFAETEGWAGGVHGLLAILVLVLAAVVAMQALREVRAMPPDARPVGTGR